MAKHISIILGALLIAGAVMGAAFLIGRGGGGARAGWQGPENTYGVTPATGMQQPVKGAPPRRSERPPVAESPTEAEIVGRWKCGPVTAEYYGDGRVSCELEGAQQQLDALSMLGGLSRLDGRGWARYTYEAGVLTVILADVPYTGHVVWLKKPNEMLVNCRDEEGRPISERGVRASPGADAEPGPGNADLAPPRPADAEPETELPHDAPPAPPRPPKPH